MKDKRGGGGGWWPSLVPTPAAAARRVSLWVGRASGPEDGGSAGPPATPPTAQRPTSLVISHQQSPQPSQVQRPSCSPPPPPPRSPAGSSYNTADEDSDRVSNLESCAFNLPSSPDGEFLQDILDTIDSQHHLGQVAPDSGADGSEGGAVSEGKSVEEKTEKVDQGVVPAEETVPESVPALPEEKKVEEEVEKVEVVEEPKVEEKNVEVLEEKKVEKIEVEQKKEEKGENPPELPSSPPPELPSSPPPELFKPKDAQNINLEDGLTTLTRRLRKMAEVLENSPIGHLKEGSGSTPGSPGFGTPTKGENQTPLQKLVDEAAKKLVADVNGNKIEEAIVAAGNEGADANNKENTCNRALTPDKHEPTNSSLKLGDEKIEPPPSFTDAKQEINPAAADDIDAEVPIVKGFFTVNFDLDSLTTLNSGVATAAIVPAAKSAEILEENFLVENKTEDLLQTPASSEIFSTPLANPCSNPFFQKFGTSSNPFQEIGDEKKAADEPILFADDAFVGEERIKAADSVEDFTDNFVAPAAQIINAAGTCLASAAAAEQAETCTPAPAAEAITCKQDDERLPQDLKIDSEAKEKEDEIKKEVDVKNEEKVEITEEEGVILAKKDGILKELSAVLEKKSVKFNLQAPIAMGEDDVFPAVETPSPKFPKIELKGARPKLEITLPKVRVKKVDDADDSGPESTTSSERDGDFTLDDATDIALDETPPGTPVPDEKPTPPPAAVVEAAKEASKSESLEMKIKEVGPEDDYVELARAVSNYENMEFKRRPGSRLISKRRLHALHPPKLGAVRHSLSKAWFAMRDWGTETGKKIGEKLSRDSVALSEEQAEAAASASGVTACASVPPPLPARGNSEPPPILPRVICERARSVRLMSPGLDDVRASKYLPIEGQSGFDELRRYMKQGGDFCKELSAILQERSEAEAQYAKSLNKLSAKLARNAKDAVGSVSAAWQHAAAQMESEGEAHRDAAAALAERVVRPLKSTLEAQHRVRKSVESAVDKSGKGLAEWRMQEAKAKKGSFACARENERLQDALQEAQRLGRSGRNPGVSDKEIVKLEAKRRKAEESVKKSDVEYYTYCVRAERARLEWETAVNRGSQCFQALEEERLQHLKELIEQYYQILTQMGPKIVQSAERMTEPVQNCDVARDLQTVASVKGVGQPIPEQLLPDFYPEHVTLAMNRDRRRLALLKLLQLIRQDLDRERRAKQGVENLARALQQTPTFGNEDSQQNVSDKLHHMRSMLTYLEAARYKVQSTLAELNGDRRGSHPLASHIQVTRDRQGLQQSVLKVPPWVREDSIDGPDWPDRGTGDGNSVQPDSDFDEFSSQASDDKDFGIGMPVIGETVENEDNDIYPSLGQCRALYDYAANLCDELNLSAGDLITIREKQEDGWWLGELNGVVGIFPATYVEVLEKN